MSVILPKSLTKHSNQPHASCLLPVAARRSFWAIAILWLSLTVEPKAQLIDIALSNAVEDINRTMLDPRFNPTLTPMPLVYPDWGSLARAGGSQLDVMWSYNSFGADAEILDGQATEFIPGGNQGDPMDLLVQSSWARPTWITNGVQGGRIAYVVINASGLLDANYVGGSNRLWSTSVAELDISGLPEILGTGPGFYADRAVQGPYLSPQELEQQNSAVIGPLSTLTTFSQDPGRDQVFLTRVNPGYGWWNYIDFNRPASRLGQPDAANYLHDKFNLNSITNAELNVGPAGDINRYAGRAFRDNYFNPLRDILATILHPNERPSDVAWNIINYLDEDRIPQGEDNMPWTHTGGGEPIPMINEIVVEEIPAPPSTICLGPSPGNVQTIPNPLGPAYRLSVEVWYPYAPVKVEPQDNFSFQLGIFENAINTSLNVLDSPGSISLLRLKKYRTLEEFLKIPTRHIVWG
jgi:hypothetical protein